MATKKQTKKRAGLKRLAVHHTKRLVVPHKKNDYQPHLIRRWEIITILSIVIVLQFVADLPLFKPQSVVLGDQTDDSQRQLLEDTNAVRKANDVPYLNSNPKLNEASKLKAKDMFERQYWSHNAPDGTTPWYWYRKVNYRYDFAGENLAKGFETSSAVVDAWMRSEEHRRNMLNPSYQDVGFAVAEGTLNGESTELVVALYGSPVGAPSQSGGQVLAANSVPDNLITRFGTGLQMMNPVHLASLVLILLAALVALIAHVNRKKLPPKVRKTWKRHHALYKFVLLMVAGFGVVMLYGGAQIL